MNSKTIIAAALLTACAPSAGTARTAPHPVEVARRVVARDMVPSAAELVARGYARSGLDQLTAPGPFFVLVNEQGWTCLVDGRTFALVSTDELYACRWRAPRRGV